MAATSSQSWLLLLFLHASSCLASLHLHANTTQLMTASNKVLVRKSLGILFSTIRPELSYYAGTGFSFSNSSVTVTLFFHPRSLCGPTLKSKWIPSATGKDLKVGFNETVEQLNELLDSSYNTGYVVYGQFLAGYFVDQDRADVQSWRSYGCSDPLNNKTHDDDVGYCYGFDSILMAGTPFDTLFNSCTLGSPDKRFVLQTKSCNVAVVNTATKMAVWNPSAARYSDCSLTMQTDWNLVLYNTTIPIVNSAQWASGGSMPRWGDTTGLVWLELGVSGDLTTYFSSGNGGPPQTVWRSSDYKWFSFTEVDFNNIFGDALELSPVQVIPEVTPKSSDKLKVMWIALVAALAFGFACLVAIVIWQRRLICVYKGESKVFADSKPEKYSLSSLIAATQDFHDANKLGEGGSATVYKGITPAGPVAIKLLKTKTRSISYQEFKDEVSTISRLQHKNLIKLLGYCSEGDNRLLVYEFLENNSLASALLTGPCRLHISWSKRFNICLGVAQGIAYLHEESRPRIVHRDIKASNVLLDKELNPRVCDFGLARLFKDDDTHVTTRVAGTIGYLAPEYGFSGKLTEKADIYSFGILLLEILSGRCNIDLNLPSEKVFLLEWAWNLYENGNWLELIDKNLVPETCPREEVQRVLMISLICTQGSPSSRPPMSRVVAMLLGDITPTSRITRPGFIADVKHKVNSQRQS